VDGASRNRIAGNAIEGVARRDPFPGTTDRVLRWGIANGSAIWISALSEDNEIVDNVFADLAGRGIYLQGRGNTVRVDDPRMVANRGRNNVVETRAGGG